MEEITYQSYIPHDGNNQYIFVRSDAHATCYGALATCSYSKGETMILEVAVGEFTEQVYEDCSLDCRHDPTWQHMALLANDDHHAQEMTTTLKHKGYEVIKGIDVLWP